MIKLASDIGIFAENKLHLSDGEASETHQYKETFFIDCALNRNQLKEVLQIFSLVMQRSADMIMLLDSFIRQIEIQLPPKKKLTVDNLEVAQGLIAIFETILMEDVPNAQGILACLSAIVVKSPELDKESMIYKNKIVEHSRFIRAKLLEKKSGSRFTTIEKADLLLKSARTLMKSVH